MADSLKAGLQQHRQLPRACARHIAQTEWTPAQTAPLDASGNALGPFQVGQVGQVVRVRTLVANSARTLTTAPRTITLEEPIG